MIYTLKTNEVDIQCEWEQNELKGLDKENVKIKITAKGDLPHHVIEGILDCLKKIDPNNSHLDPALHPERNNG